MKKIVALIVVLCLAVSVTACGGGETSENGHVADQYHQLLDGKDTTYYYEADVVEQFVEDGAEEPSESIMAEGRDGKDRYVIMAGDSELDQRQIETEDTCYVIFDPDKEYTAEPKEDGEESLDLKYVTTSEMELDGKTYRYDEYQAEYEMYPILEDSAEGDAEAEIYLYVKRYLVDNSGKLYAIVTLNELKGSGGEENELIYQKTDTITKFQEGSVPDGIFDIPKDYKEINYDDEEYQDEMYEDEVISEEE